MMLDERIAIRFAMEDDVWKRHANGWSVWTRVATFPFLLLAIWSHAWIGWAGAIVATGLVCIWLWINPRAFPAPATTDTWHARATFGERLWLFRRELPIPRHHETAASILAGVALVGTLVAFAGAIMNWLWPTLLGTVLLYAGKLWFLDRMVWLYEDMKDTAPEYRSWLY